MKITGHETNSIYRRYRIVDEKELRDAQERMQKRLGGEKRRSKVAAIAGEVAQKQHNFGAIGLDPELS